MSVNLKLYFLKFNLRPKYIGDKVASYILSSLVSYNNPITKYSLCIYIYIYIYKDMHIYIKIFY